MEKLTQFRMNLSNKDETKDFIEKYEWKSHFDQKYIQLVKVHYKLEKYLNNKQ